MTEMTDTDLDVLALTVANTYYKYLDADARMALAYLGDVNDPGPTFLRLVGTNPDRDVIFARTVEILTEWAAID